METLEAIATLMRQAVAAYTKVRFQYALELFERALALAEATQPADSLVTAFVLHSFCFSRVKSYGDASVRGEHEAQRAAWREDPRTSDMSRRCLQLLLVRNDAGTLSCLTPDEAFYQKRYQEVDELTDDSAKWLGGSALLKAASMAITGWAYVKKVHVYGDADLDLLVRAVLATLRLTMQRCTERITGERVGELKELEVTFMINSIDAVNLAAVIAESRPYLPVLRMHGLTSAEEQKMSRVLSVLETRCNDANKRMQSQNAARKERAAADVARHGLRRCTLPDCGAQEPHPKAFKLCGRCKSVAYCSPEHAAQDWRRHKRDGCSSPAAAE
jgi:hypothetical protein